MKDKNFFYSIGKNNFFEISSEIHLFFKFIRLLPMDSLLSIGCCSHELYRLILDTNHNLTAVDCDEDRLISLRDEFDEKISTCTALMEDLPFSDNEFEYSFFFNTLRFAKDPLKTLEEVFRVTKHAVFIGLENRYAIKGMQKAIHGFFFPDEREKLFSIWELKQMVKELAGDVPVKWRTVTMMNHYQNFLLKKLGYNDFFEKIPFGNFIGILVVLQPKYELKPMILSTRGQEKLNVAGNMLRGD